MYNLKASILGLVVGLLVVAAANDTGVPVAPVGITSGIIPQPTATPAPTSTTKPTDPTTQSTTSSTTVAPSTSTSSTPTTTIKPTEPTSVAPVTTPKPITPEEGTWEVISSGNNSCILLHMMAVIDVYYTADNQTKVDQYPVPKSATATGNCGALEQNIRLSWPHNDTIIDSIEFGFKKNDTKFDLETVTLNVTIDTHMNSTKLLYVNRTKEEFTTPITMSYKCTKAQLLNFTMPTSNDTVASLLISNVQFQAFGNITKQTFSTAKDCEPYETPDIVPIAVGCALIALIVFVLIGYLIGRRRNQARGYLSMFTQTKKEEDYIPMKNLSCFQ